MPDSHRLLFVESNAAFNLFAKSVIELDHLPLHVHYEFSPIQALEYMRKCVSDQFPTVVIAEFRLPFCSGYEFINRCIQEFYDDHPNTLFYISSNSVRYQDEQSIAAHPLIVGLLPKPFTKQVYVTHLLPHLEIDGAIV